MKFYIILKMKEKLKLYNENIWWRIINEMASRKN